MQPQVNLHRVHKKRESKLPLLIASILSFALLMLLTPTAQAADPSAPDPGPGGGCIANCVFGQVVNYDTGAGVPNQYVYLYVWGGSLQLWTTTDSGGFFVFTNQYIQQSVSYTITVNGVIADSDPVQLGVGVDDPAWSQWAGTVTTDSQAIGIISPHISPAPSRNVPAAALFSNTPHAALQYVHQTSSGYTFQHTATFAVENAGITVGYEQNMELSTTDTFSPPATYSWFMYQPSFAGSVWCDGGTASSQWSCGSQGVKAAGINAKNPYYFGLQASQTSEYINTASVPACSTQITRNCYQVDNVPPTAGTGSITKTITESGSYTWSLSTPFGIQYPAYGVTLKLDTTATSKSGVSNTIGVTETNLTSSSIQLAIYFPNGVYDSNTGKEIGGMELHVWDIPPPGGGGGGGCKPISSVSGPQMPIC